jgi:Ca2+-binding RTX toxin-like protein
LLTLKAAVEREQVEMGFRPVVAAFLLAGVTLAFPVAAAQGKAGDIISGTTSGDVVRTTKGGAQDPITEGPPLQGVGALDFGRSPKVLFEADYGADTINAIDVRSGDVDLINDDDAFFGEPLGLAVGPDKQLYVADEALDHVVRVNPATGAAEIISDPGAFTDPYPLTLAPKGTIFVGDEERIIRVNPNTGADSEVAQVAGAGFQGLEYAPSGVLYAMDENDGRVIKVNPKTGATDEVAQDTALVGSYHLAIEPKGTLVVGSFSEEAVMRVNPRTGSVTEVPGGDVANIESITVEPPKCKGKLATIVGSQKRDKLKGSKFGDVIVGLKGNDKISGGKGKDLICGGKGKDKLKGGKGRDKLDGGPGKDREQQ